MDCAKDAHKQIDLVIDDTSYIRGEIITLQCGYDAIQEERDRAGLDKIMAWLSPTDFSSQHSDIISRKQQGTGQWFLSDPQFTRWLDKPSGTLFCPGIPGAGKTMIAAIAIDHLMKTAHGSDIAVSYAYCNYKTQQRGGAELLAAILKQIVQVRPSVMEPVELLYEQHSGLRTKPSYEEIEKTTQSVLGKLSTVYVLVDALDESYNRNGNRRRFLETLRLLQLENDLRLMVTSRHIPEIVDEFKEALTVEVRASSDDIRRFIAGQMCRLPKCIRCDAVLQELVQDQVVEAADGMCVVYEPLQEYLLMNLGSCLPGFI